MAQHLLAGGGGGRGDGRTDVVIASALAEQRHILKRQKQLTSRARAAASFQAFLKDQEPAMVIQEANNPGIIENGAKNYLLTHQRQDKLGSRRGLGCDLIQVGLNCAVKTMRLKAEGCGLPWQRAVVLGAGSSFGSVFNYLRRPELFGGDRIYAVDLLPLTEHLPNAYPPTAAFTQRLIHGNTERMDEVMAAVDTKERELGVLPSASSGTAFVLENSVLRVAGFQQRAQSLRVVAKAEDVVVLVQFEEGPLRDLGMRQAQALVEEGFKAVAVERRGIGGKVYRVVVLVPPGSPCAAQPVVFDRPSPLPIYSPNQYRWGIVYLMLFSEGGGGAIQRAYCGSAARIKGSPDDIAWERFQEHMELLVQGKHHARETNTIFSGRLKEAGVTAGDLRRPDLWTQVQAEATPLALVNRLGGRDTFFQVVAVLERGQNETVEAFIARVRYAEQQGITGVLGADSNRFKLLNASTTAGYMDAGCKSMGGNATTLHQRHDEVGSGTDSLLPELPASRMSALFTDKNNGGEEEEA